jgi:hypothetical protein
VPGSAPGNLGHDRREHALKSALRKRTGNATVSALEPPIDHRDVTTIMGLLGDIQHDVVRIRRLLEDEDGQEEASEDDT